MVAFFRIAGRSNSDEIPEAKRFGLKGFSNIRRYRRLSFLAIGISLSVLFSGIWTNKLSVFSLNGTNSLKGYADLPAPDGRLLGHFPYPEASQDQLVEVYPGLKIHIDTYKSYKLMKAAARLEGIELSLLSGYRSHSLQREIFFEIKSNRNQTAIERARVSAPPGYSEHSTGYAIDLGEVGRPETDFEVEFESTKTFKWLEKNAAKYHFILSFPKGNKQGVDYEPWHWRYEGTAKALREFEESRRFIQSLN